MTTTYRTFKIQTANGPVDAEQYATFTRYIQSEQFRFVVTRETPLSPFVVTHRASGKKVAEITHTELAACLNNKEDAGKLALSKLIDRAGEARVRSVLAAAEKAR